MELLLVLGQIGGGLVLFLFSISMLSNTLKKVSSVQLKSFLLKATDNPVKGACVGTLVTFVVQSSSITVLLLMGLVNAGIMNLRQAVYVILGSEIGTTITAQIVAFKVKMFFYPLMIAGFVLSLLDKKEKLKHVGEILFFLGLIFLSMKVMSDGAKPLGESPAVLDFLKNFGTYPVMGILLGAILTAITNSSSATTTLIIALSMEGVIELPSGIALIIGANLGTCILELIASVRSNIAARRTGLAQFVINLVGVLLFYPFLDLFAELISLTASDTPRLIANAHTLFNVIVSLIFMPFVGVLIHILNTLVSGGDEPADTSQGTLEDKFLAVPALALSEAEQEVHKMASIVAEQLSQARKAFFDNDKHVLELLRENEKTVDSIHENVGSYLRKISSLMLSERDLARKRVLVHVVDDLERIADLAENIAEYVKMEDIVFSDKSKRDLKIFFENAIKTYTASVDSLKIAGKTLDLETDKNEYLFADLKKTHKDKFFLRMQQFSSRPVVDALYPNVLRDIERIKTHAKNIAIDVQKMK